MHGLQCTWAWTPVHSISVWHGTAACPWAGSALFSSLQRDASTPLSCYGAIKTWTWPCALLTNTLLRYPLPGRRVHVLPVTTMRVHKGKAHDTAVRENLHGHFQFVIKVETEWWSWLQIIFSWSYVLLLYIQYGPANKPLEESWCANGLKVLKPVLALFQTIKLLTDKVPSPLQQNRTNFRIRETPLWRDL